MVESAMRPKATKNQDSKTVYFNPSPYRQRNWGLEVKWLAKVRHRVEVDWENWDPDYKISACTNMT